MVENWLSYGWSKFPPILIKIKCSAPPNMPKPVYPYHQVLAKIFLYVQIMSYALRGWCCQSQECIAHISPRTSPIPMMLAFLQAG